LHEAGISPDEPSVQRALTFVSRAQNLRATNKALSSSEETLRKRSWELEQEVLADADDVLAAVAEGYGL